MPDRRQGAIAPGPPGRANRSVPLLPIAACTLVTAGLLALAPPALAGDAGLTPGPKVAITDPGSIAVGDFNRDGRPDLAVVSLLRTGIPGTVQILLGAAGGGFTKAPAVASTGNDPRQVVVGDFDADGDDDLAITNLDGRNVTVRLGDGEGVFAVRLPDVAIGNRRPYSIVAGDFNGDNREDLAVSAGDLTGGATYIRLGTPKDGTVTFVDGQTIDGVLAPLVVGDFNGDSIEDLATGDASAAGGRVLLGTGGGAFGAPKSLGLPRPASVPHNIAVGDFDNDHRQDLAAAMTDVVSVRLAPVGAASPGTDTQLRGAPVALAIGDLNSDGNEDMVIADNSDSPALRVRLGTGNGGFRDAATIPHGQGLVDAALADLDGDGNDDVVVSDLIADEVQVLRGTGAPALAGNLLVNGGFEGPGWATGLDSAPAIPGWERTGGMTFIRYGFPAHAFFPARVAAPRHGGGNSLLWGGRSTSTDGITTAFQTVDVARFGPAIDGGRSTATLTRPTRRRADVPDTMKASAEFRSATGAPLGDSRRRASRPSDRGNLTGLITAGAHGAGAGRHAQHPRGAHLRRRRQGAVVRVRRQRQAHAAAGCGAPDHDRRRDAGRRRRGTGRRRPADRPRHAHATGLRGRAPRSARAARRSASRSPSRPR